MTDDLTEKAYIDPNPRPLCGHRCLLSEGHDIGEEGSHLYGYNVPSDAVRIAELEAEIERLRAALRLACVDVYGQCDPLNTSPDELVNHYMDEAVRGD